MLVAPRAAVAPARGTRVARPLAARDYLSRRPLPSPARRRSLFRAAPQPFEVPTEFLKPADDGDCLVVSAAAGGLFLCMAVAAALPSWGVPAEHVMAAGMLTLLTGILYAVFVPSCGARRGKDGRATPGAEDVVTPVAVFLVTGCIGTMLGGMFGSTLKYMRWEDYLAPFKG